MITDNAVSGGTTFIQHRFNVPCLLGHFILDPLLSWTACCGPSLAVIHARGVLLSNIIAVSYNFRCKFTVQRNNCWSVIT